MKSLRVALPTDLVGEKPSDESGLLEERPGEMVLLVRGGLEATKRAVARRCEDDTPSFQSCCSSIPLMPSDQRVEPTDADDLSRGGK